MKHYINSKYSDLISSLRKEIGKVKKLNPQKYYVCCVVKLTAKNKQEIYELFSEYMESANSVLSLLYNIEEDSKEFVATHCYYECLEILEQERMLLLLGMHGTGKTATTKMLALYYASKGYRIRYTTNRDIRDLKNALSTQKELSEVVLLDDCLGQHYFMVKKHKKMNF